MKHVHLIGIGGFGLSAIARVLIEKGYKVSGSDQAASPLFNALKDAGATTFIGHHTQNITGADLVIRSSAIPDDNPEVTAARDAGIPIIKRSEFLEELTQGKDTLAVAGSHGKTTTTAMLIWILHQLGSDPSFIAGGMVKQLHSNAHAGTGPYFVIEADEYDHMFLGLSPMVAIVTNIEHDHPDFFHTKEDYRQAFKAFLDRLRPDGMAFMCLDDPETLNLAKEIKSSDKKILGYGMDQKADYFADKVTIADEKIHFKLLHKNSHQQVISLGDAAISIPGRHNVLNATATLGTIHQLGLPLSEAIQALADFSGAGRRFEILGAADGVLVVDDYGHHPTEIAATLDAAREHYPDCRIWAVWQPHTFSRIKTLEADFIRALNRADRVVVLKIYAAREANHGYSAERIAEALAEGKAAYKADFVTAGAYLLHNLVSNDVVIVFSAGDATEVSQMVLSGLQERESKMQGA